MKYKATKSSSARYLLRTMTEETTYTTTVSTPLIAEKLRAIVKQQCRNEFGIELIAHDPLQIPHLRIFELRFNAVEDRDRAVIALRMAIGSGTAKPAQASASRHRSAV
jgi:hypothetical protein